MARPNHQFEKRQRELAKKKKKEQKRQRKLDRKLEKAADETPAAPEGVESEDPTATTLPSEIEKHPNEM